MKKNLKNNLKSVRLSDFTLAVVEGCQGEGFNQKFENLCYDYAQHDRDIQQRIKQLHAEERELVKRIDKLRATANKHLADVNRYLQYAADLAKNAPIPGQQQL